MRETLLVSVAIIACVVIAPVAVEGKTIYVNTTGWWVNPALFNQSSTPIQDALENASTGDLVKVVEIADYPEQLDYSTVNNGVILDLGEATLNGTGLTGSGITITGKSDILIKNGTVDGFGQAINFSGTNDNISLLGLTILNTGGASIDIAGTLATNITIKDVSITNTTYGIRTDYTSGVDARRITIINTTIKDISQRGIWFEEHSWYGSYLGDIYLYNVTVANSSQYGMYITTYLLPWSGNVTILNSNVTGCSYHGVYVYANRTIKIENNTVSNNGFGGTYWGVAITGYNNPTVVFYNNTIVSNSGGLYLQSLIANVNDSVINNPANDIYLVSSTVATYNTSFNKSLVYVDANSRLDVYWYLHITVVDPASNPVAGATVRVYNTTGSLVLSALTDVQGNLNLTLREYVKNSTVELYESPYTIMANKTGVGRNQSVVVLNCSKSIIIELTNLLPIPVFTFSPNLPRPGETVEFNASGSYDPDGLVALYLWDFGDGSTSTGVTVMHTYSSAGTYVVTLSVTDSDGATNTTTAQIRVKRVSQGGAEYIPPPLEATSEVVYTTVVTLQPSREIGLILPRYITDSTGVQRIGVEMGSYQFLSVAISKVKELPDNVSFPPHNVYTIFEVVFTKYGTARKVEPSGTISFKVPRIWITENAGDYVFLMEYNKSENKWVEIPTVKVSEDESYEYFKSNLSSFSIFAIVCEAAENSTTTTTTPITVSSTTISITTITTTTKPITTTIQMTTTKAMEPSVPITIPEKETPGFGFLIAIASVIILAFCLRLRK